MAQSEVSPGWDVFLCHSSKDKRRVERLHDELVSRGLRVWFDKTAILGSASIPLKVEEGLEKSRTVALCLSPAFLESEWTAYERASALHGDPSNSKDSLLLIEFAPCQLPKALAHFRRLKFHRFSPAGVDEIVASLPTTPGLRAPNPPSAVVSLLDEAKARQRTGAYVASAELTRQALELALKAGAADGEQVRELARARSGHSHALLLCDGDLEEIWTLAALGADPTMFDGYPELLFSALVTKAEAAAATGRLMIATGAASAAAELALDDSEVRVVLQLRGAIALQSHSWAKAVELYRDAERSFLAVLSGGPDAATRARAHVGVGSCLTNQALAHRQVGDLTAAKIALSRAAEWYVQGCSPSDESAARRLLARCYFEDEEWEPGFTALDRAQELAAQEKLMSGLIDCLELRARALATTDQPRLARAALLHALNELGDDDPETRRRFHQMLATLAKQEQDADAAQHHLEIARALAEQSGNTIAIAAVAHQAEGLAKHGRQQVGPAPDEVIKALHARLESTESPSEAAYTMQKIAGAYRSHEDLERAGGWYQRAHAAAMEIGDKAVAASALIGLAECEITEDDDGAASNHLEDALALIDRLPAWEVKSSALFFTGRLLARGGDLRAARRTLEKAYAIATKHHVEELATEIERLRDEIDDWLSMRAFPARDLAELARLLASLEDWYPEAQRDLRHLWWYWVGDEVMRNLSSNSGAKCLVASDDPNEIRELANDLGALFDVSTFVTESSFARGDPVITLVPFPDDLPFPYVNYFAVTEVT
jgi:tetratricopeptide (TPR) repeat protein